MKMCETYSGTLTHHLTSLVGVGSGGRVSPIGGSSKAYISLTFSPFFWVVAVAAPAVVI